MKDDAVYPNNYYEQYEPQWGLTKREYFASMAMQGYLSNPEFVGDMSDAVRAADALLEELAK